ncbi:MAG: methylmalonyl Co-A mutase-associated GTPase MeaB [Chloroflexi bacterium]|nr:methylmalonyl Co-A mutase-associated GTPase MeaB [Chloroflexota bacterium]
MRPSSVPRASPRSSAPGRQSPRSPRTCATTPAPATDVAPQGAEAHRPDPAARAAELTSAAVAGDRRALARLLTAVENRTSVAETALRTLYPKAGTAHLVGITGAPGAGKSTLVSALIAAVRERGRSVGVIAVDPSSPITGGALLGDRVRMQAYAGDRDVFIRSMASRGHAGGLASTSAAAAAVLDACGFDLVLIETVGTGQSEVEVAAAADTTVVLEAPEMGDEVQAIKAGLLEVADIVVVNKGDRPGAQRTASQLRAMLVAVGRVGAAERGHHGPGAGSAAEATAPAQAASEPATATSPATPADTAPRARPKEPVVLVTTATSGEGIDALLAALDAHRAKGRGVDGATARLARAEAQVWAILAERIRAELHAPERRVESDDILRAVADHELDPFAAADRLLDRLRA